MGSVSVKHRLLGALVLISLVVIFVPMLLDEKWKFGSVIQKSNIPAEPKIKFTVTDSGKLKQIAPLSESPDAVTLVDDNFHGEKENELDVHEKLENQKIVEPDIELDSKKQELVNNTGEEKSPTTVQNKDDIKKTPAPIYKTGSQPAGISAWAVQLGSFKSKKNAVDLKDRLHKNKYTAYIESYKSDDGTAFRVRVGPELRLDQAKLLKSKLAAEMKIEGIIMQH